MGLRVGVRSESSHRGLESLKAEQGMMQGTGRDPVRSRPPGGLNRLERPTRGLEEHIIVVSDVSFVEPPGV